MIDNRNYTLINDFFNDPEQKVILEVEIPKLDEARYQKFVLYSYSMLALIFIKFKNQLKMNRKLNSVIQLVEAALKDAGYFFAYYILLTCFFCASYMILGSTISSDEYGGLDTIGGHPVRFVYYLVQSFRNSIGDLQTPQY